MPNRDVAQTEAELERLRIELAILRAAKMRDDLTKLVDHNPLESFDLNEIGQIDSRLHDVESGARDLAKSQPDNESRHDEQTSALAPLVLHDPLPKAVSISIEQVTAKYAKKRAAQKTANSK